MTHPEDEKALLATLQQQENELQFTEFTRDMALTLGLGLVRAAKDAGVAVMVDIRLGDLLLFGHAMAGTTGDNADWVRRKNNVVRRYAHSSFFMGTLYRSRGTQFEVHTGLDPREYAAAGGAFPILIKGVGMVGTITVSGLPQEQDHAMVVAQIRQLLGSSRA